MHDMNKMQNERQKPNHEGNNISHSRKWQELELQIWKVTSGVLQTRIARPPTTHRNRGLPDIFRALASTMVFSVMDGPKNVMQLRLRPAQDEKSIFCHDFLSLK